MNTSLPNRAPSAPPDGDFDEDPYGGDSRYEAQLRGLSAQQLADRLNWLSWYQPGIFAAVMDYGQFSDDLAADTGPSSPDPGSGGGCAVDPVPVCARCGAEIGIFVRFGLQWRHYRGGQALGRAEIFDPGHDPEPAWRLPDPAPAGR